MNRLKCIFIGVMLIAICAAHAENEESLNAAEHEEVVMEQIIEMAVCEVRWHVQPPESSPLISSDAPQEILTADAAPMDEAIAINEPSAVSEPIAQENSYEFVRFTVPEHWSFADLASLPKTIKVMVVGKGNFEFPPSLHLGTEPFVGTLKEYMQIIKEINEAKNVDWRDLGMIQTEAGRGHLIQMDKKTQWGDVRYLQLILIRNEVVHIMTAAALKKEFSKFYKEFFASLKSLHVEKEEQKQSL